MPKTHVNYLEAMADICTAAKQLHKLLPPTGIPHDHHDPDDDDDDDDDMPRSRYQDADERREEQRIRAMHAPCLASARMSCLGMAASLWMRILEHNSSVGEPDAPASSPMPGMPGVKYVGSFKVPMSGPGSPQSPEEMLNKLFSGLFGPPMPGDTEKPSQDPDPEDNEEPTGK